MDVETLVAGLALRREEVVTGGGQVEEISIEGLEMEISPCAAELGVVRRSHFCSEADGAIITQNFKLLILVFKIFNKEQTIIITIYNWYLAHFLNHHLKKRK